MKKVLRQIRWTVFLWAAAITLLLESPAVLFIKNAARLVSTQEINRIGILAIVRFTLMALLAFALGLLVFLRQRNTEVKVSSADLARLEKQKQNRLSRLILGLAAAILPLFTVAEPCINLFVRRGLEAELVEVYWSWLFLAGGLTVLLTAAAVLRFVLIKRVRVTVDEALPAGAGKRRRAVLITGLTAAGLTAVLAFAVMRNGSWLLQPYISTIPSVAHTQHAISYDRESGVYTLDAGDGDFRILQLTDIHLGGSVVSAEKDRAALEAVYTLVESEHPDLIIITGDSVFPLGVMSFSLNNYVPMLQLASFLRNLGVPWAITFGNHDTEDIATHDEADIGGVFAQFGFEKTGSLLYPETQPAITGRSNQMLLLKNSDGSVREALFLLDSGDYQSGAINDYDYIHDDQVQWYAESLKALESEYGTMPPSLLFFHIPLQEYQTAYGLYKAGSGEVEYHYGVVGEDGEAICASSTGSTLFETAVALGSTRGMFVGHDHYNNISLTYQGIRLTYGMSIDYLAMPGIAKRDAQRGGTRITVHPDGSFDCEQLPLRDLMN